nr:MAG TPA: hypothetical protein [Caudoviricetes sp.]
MSTWQLNTAHVNTPRNSLFLFIFFVCNTL